MKTTAAVSSLWQKSTSLTGDRLKSMEIKLFAFLAKHDLAISLSDDVVDLLRSLLPKDEVPCYLWHRMHSMARAVPSLVFTSVN